MSEILCSTGAIIGKANNRNYRLLEDLSKQLSCDGFEFMMYSSWYDEAEELVKALCEMKLNIPVVHCDKHIGEYVSGGDFKEACRLFGINCDIAKRINAKKMVLHLWNGTISDSNFANNIKGYAYLNEMAEGYGLDLLVENVICNRENPMKHLKELADAYSDIHFTFDTKMAAFHGQLELLYEPEYEWLWKRGYIGHYHVNDYAGGYMDWRNMSARPIGAGHVDFERFFEFVKKTGYDDTFTVEASAVGMDGVVDTERLNRQFEFIRDNCRK